jgi:hypothetical protein
MKHLKRYYFLLLLLALPILLLHSTGCVKEYSFEGAPQDTISIPVHDTIPSDTVISSVTLPPCDLCNPSDEIATGQWSFKTGNSYTCGSFTNSGFFGGNLKNAFTFFGPSACSVDTGIVVSVYLPLPLDQDRFDLDASQTAFYYYDHNATKDIFISQPTAVFTVTVNSFIYATGIATGTFSGKVFTANGDTAYITDGRFKAPLY